MTMTPEEPPTNCPVCGAELMEVDGFVACPNSRVPSIGGCWLCEHGHGPADDMRFDMEFDTYYHPICLPNEYGSLLEYELDAMPEHKVHHDPRWRTE